MTIVRLGAHVVGSSPAARQFFIIIIIIIIVIIIYKRRLHAVYQITKDVCHNLWRAQTALIHYTRGPAE